MNRLQEITASWVAWTRLAPSDVMESITLVQLNQHEGGYDVHISARHGDQTVVDKFAAALGRPTDEGWEPDSGNCKRQWSLAAERDGLFWHVTVTQDWPFEAGRRMADAVTIPTNTAG